VKETSEQLRFDGEVGVVTGAAQGMGRAHATFLASRGMKVVVNDLGVDLSGSGVDPLIAERAAENIREAGGEAVASGESVATWTGAANIVQKALDTWGRLDVVVNNAGIVDASPYEQIAESRLRAVIDTNLLGTMFVCRHAWPVMVDAGRGRIITTSSGAVFGSEPGQPYQASKAAILSLTRSLALLGAKHGIKVNAILPTALTRMTEGIPNATFRELLERRFTTERIAQFVAVLAHESCEPSGEAFLVGGGRVARMLYAVTDGAIFDETSPELYAARLNEIRDTAVVHYPDTRFAEFQLYLGDLGFPEDALKQMNYVRSIDDAAGPTAPEG
jgi:NAD(P)-dependent dehydrogenase (short-subunit alcohol dehydrogenase family)